MQCVSKSNNILKIVAAFPVFECFKCYVDPVLPYPSCFGSGPRVSAVPPIANGRGIVLNKAARAQVSRTLSSAAGRKVLDDHALNSMYRSWLAGTVHGEKSVEMQMIHVALHVRLNKSLEKSEKKNSSAR